MEGVVTKLTQSEGGRRALRLLSSGVGEAAEEVISDAVEPALEAILDGKTGYGRDTAAALAQSALVGGILGALGGGVQLGKDAASGTQTDAPVRETTEADVKNETAASGTETAESTAVNDDPARHTQTEQRIIQAYKNSTDDALRRMNYLI